MRGNKREVAKKEIRRVSGSKRSRDASSSASSGTPRPPIAKVAT